MIPASCLGRCTLGECMRNVVKEILNNEIYDPYKVDVRRDR
jgi:hypothetical protein